MKLLPSIFIFTALNHGIATLSFAEQSVTLDKAISALKVGDVQQANTLFEKQPDDVESMIYLARIYMNSDLDDAEDWIEKATNKEPDNAKSQYWRGRVMGSQAQNSVFSALSYAGKSLDSFTKAVALKPDSVEYNNALMQFHLQAPSIAGGDLKIAKEIVAKLKQLDLVAGTKAEIDLSFAEDDTAKASLLLREAKQTFHDIPDFFFQSGMIYQRDENYPDAISELSLAASKIAKTDQSIKAKYNAMYQIGKSAVMSESNIEMGIQALEQYISETPDIEGMPPKAWAEFRLANLLALNSQKPQAKEIYSRLAKVKDKELAKQAKKAARKI